MCSITGKVNFNRKIEQRNNNWTWLFMHVFLSFLCTFNRRKPTERRDFRAQIKCQIVTVRFPPALGNILPWETSKRFISSMQAANILPVVMLVLHPVGGAMFLKSLGMLLEEGRRGSMPQAHTLLHKLRRKKPGKKVRAQVEPERRNLDIYHLSPSDILWSRRLRQSQRDPLMAVEEQKKLPGKSQPKIIENLKKKTHFSR